MVVSHSWTWHSLTSSPWLLGWEIFLSFGSSHHIKASTSGCGSMLPILFSVTDMFKRSPLDDICYDTLKTHFMYAALETTLHQSHYITKILIPILCRWWGYIKSLLWRVASCRHCLIIQVVELETPFSALDLHTLMESFLFLGSRSSSLAFDRNILCGFQLQLIHSHHTDCTVVH